jgi:hypothetical protein
MPNWVAIVIIVVIIAAAASTFLYLNRRRSTQLRSRFGPEYGRALQEHGDRRRAEQELERRAKRVEGLNIRPLTPQQRDQFSEAWRTDQSRFVDDPGGAVAEADRLIADVMRARGYPVADCDRRVEDISVDHPRVVQNYRAAREVAVRHERGEATTEDLRRAMNHYGALLDELLETHEVNR